MGRNERYGNHVLAETVNERRTASECVKEVRPRGVPRELTEFDEKVREAVRHLGVKGAARALGVSVFCIQTARKHIRDFDAYQRAMAVR